MKLGEPKESVVFNIFELMSTAQGGAGMDAVARRFGLSQDQAQRTMAALMPAFALGLQRNAADPRGFANLVSMMTPGQTALWDAFSPQAKTQGEQVLGHLFGPPELTRQIAEQAAHWSGVSAQVVQQMMPIFAAALVGSLAKFSEVMRAQAAPAPSSPAPDNAAAQPFAAWAEMMRGMMGQAAPPQKAAAEAKPGPSPNPWADMVRAMSGEAPVAPEPPPPPAPSLPSPEAPAGEAGEDLQAAWSDAIQKGREAQEQYLATLQNIFDKFLGAGAERR